jgi:hypothetical protein
MHSAAYIRTFAVAVRHFVLDDGCDSSPEYVEEFTVRSPEQADQTVRTDRPAPLDRTVTVYYD